MTALRGRSQMTSAKFSGFWTPSLPLVSTKSTQPPSLSSEIGLPPPSPSLLTSFVNGPLCRVNFKDRMRLEGVAIFFFDGL